MGLNLWKEAEKKAKKAVSSIIDPAADEAKRQVYNGSKWARGPAFKAGIDATHQLVLHSPVGKVVLPWPGDASNTESSTSEPYIYRVSADKRAELSAFVTALAASANKNCMLAIHKITVTAGRRA